MAGETEFSGIRGGPRAPSTAPGSRKAGAYGVAGEIGDAGTINRLGQDGQMIQDWFDRKPSKIVYAPGARSPLKPPGTAPELSPPVTPPATGSAAGATGATRSETDDAERDPADLVGTTHHHTISGDEVESTLFLGRKPRPPLR
jgi:hypothetical protein